MRFQGVPPDNLALESHELPPQTLAHKCRRDGVGSTAATAIEQKTLLILNTRLCENK
jgi:hypothetical protein